MRYLLRLTRNNLSFLLPYLLVLGLSLFFLVTSSKINIHLAMNAHYSSLEDLLMPWITWLGDGWTVTVLVLLLFALDRKFALFTGISCLLASGITQLLKHTLYYGLGRPAIIIPGKSLRFVPGIEQHYFDTFPSGHSTLAFAFFFCMAMAFRNHALKFVCFFIALAVAYSRIYLSQHFLEDTFAGSLIGTLVSLIIFAVAGHYNRMTLPVDLSRK